MVLEVGCAESDVHVWRHAHRKKWIIERLSPLTSIFASEQNTLQPSTSRRIRSLDAVDKHKKRPATQTSGGPILSTVLDYGLNFFAPANPFGELIT